MTDWYERRHELEPGMIFITRNGDIVMLDRTVPGDGTKWYVCDWWGGAWAYMDATIEPGDLQEQIPEEQFKERKVSA